MTDYYYLSHEAQRAADEAAARNRYYSAPCAHCGHQRREHGKFKCFHADCKCKGGHHPEPPKQ